MYLKDIVRNYTRNEMPIYSNETYNEMLAHWPNEGDIIIHRGMNFNTQEDYENFLKDYKEKGGFISDYAAGFTDSHKTAIDFATSPKTYFPTMEIVIQEEKRRTLGDDMTGHCGVILSVKAPAGTIVDLNLSGEAIESEFLLVPNKLYQCKIEKVKSLNELVNSRSFNINEYIKEKGTIADNTSKFIIMNKPRSLNNESKNLLIERDLNEFINNKKHFEDEKILLNSNYFTAILKDVGRFGEEDLKIQLFTPNLKYFELNNLMTPEKRTVFKYIANEIIQDTIKIHLEYRDKYEIDYTAIKSVTPFASKESVELYQRAIAYNKKETYENINDTLRDVFKDQSLSQKDRNKLIDKEMERMKALINGIIESAPESKTDIQIEKRDNKNRRRRILGD